MVNKKAKGTGSKASKESYFFLQLGKKSNGKIVCNEEYKLTEFFKKLDFKIPKRNMFKRMFGIGAKEEWMLKSARATLKALQSNMTDLIIADLMKKEFITMLKSMKKNGKSVSVRASKKSTRGRPKGSKNKR